MSALPNGRAKLWELWSCDAPRRTEKLAAYSLEELVAVSRELDSPDFRWFAHLRPMVAARITAKLHDANPQPHRTTMAADESKRLDRGEVTMPVWAFFGVAALSLLMAFWMLVR